MHPIKRYCNKHGLTQRAFAQQVGLSEGFVSQLVSGRQYCGREAAIQIRDCTDGEISIEKLLTWEPDLKAAS